MFHHSNLGSFGSGLPHDMNGFVPEAEDGPWDFAIDHGCQETHDDDDNLTEYGQWWEEDGFPEWQAEAIKATELAKSALHAWQNQ